MMLTPVMEVFVLNMLFLLQNMAEYIEILKKILGYKMKYHKPLKNTIKNHFQHIQKQVRKL